jgi:hypothetical protein
MRQTVIALWARATVGSYLLLPPIMRASTSRSTPRSVKWGQIAARLHATNGELDVPFWQGGLTSPGRRGLGQRAGLRHEAAIHPSPSPPRSWQPPGHHWSGRQSATFSFAEITFRLKARLSATRIRRGCHSHMRERQNPGLGVEYAPDFCSPQSELVSTKAKRTILWQLLPCAYAENRRTRIVIQYRSLPPSWLLVRAPGHRQTNNPP